jgi:hypothetical protein
MTNELKIFGKVMSDKEWVADDTYRRRLGYGLFIFHVDYHSADHPNSPWHGVSGKVVLGTTLLKAFSAKDDREHKWIGTEAEVVTFLETEARRIMRECFEIAGPMTAGRWGESGLLVLFDDQCSGAFRPARSKQ